MTSSHFPPFWQKRLLIMLGAPVSNENTRFLNAQAQAEGGLAKWNPLNTKYKLYGSTNYNTAGVQNYKRPTEGVCALALTFVNGFYNGLLGDLQSGSFTAEQIVKRNHAEIKTWGTDPNLMLTILAA